MVGEKLIRMMVSSTTIASLPTPEASGAIGSHGQAIHATTTTPAMATRRIVAVSLPMSESRRPSRSRFSVRPAMSAMNAVAIPEMTWSCAAMGCVMTLPR